LAASTALGATGALEISSGLAESGGLGAALASAGEGAQAAASTAVIQPIGQAELQEVRRLRPPVELRPDLKLTSFRLKGSIQETYEKVAREFGLDVLFDSDYQGSQQTRFELSGCDFQQAILALNDVADSFIVPVSPKLFLVAADNAEKRSELEPVIAVLQPIPDTMTPEEVTELSQAVQQSLEMKRLQIDTTRRQVFMRDTVTRVRLAQAMLAHLSKPKAEVVLDVELYAVSESDRLRLGLALPSAFPIENLSTLWNNQPSVAEGITHLLGIGGGKTVFGLAIGSSSLVASRLTTESRLVSRFRLRASSGMAASLHVGERYPIINARFSPILDESGGAGFVEPFPSFTFEDLGLVLEMVPVVHSAREVSLQFEVQFRLLTGSTANEIPIISNREFKAYARIVEGEMAVISGIGVSETFKVRTGVVGLSEIPWLGNLFKRHTRERRVSDLLVLMQPHVVRLPPAEMGPTLTLRYGPEQRPLSGI
jgi:type II secretory pathway component GspD/PulD (secretin)